MNFPYQAMLAETVTFKGHNGDLGEAYFARPLGPGPFPGVVIIHHMPGWDEWIKEVPRKLAYHGFLGIAPHLYFREGPGDPDDIGARVRAAGGVSDEQVIGDVAGSMEYLRALPYSNGKVAVMGFCSGGRHTFLVACRLPNVDAAVDCWGGNVIVDDPSLLNDKRPRAPIELSETPALPAVRHLRQRRSPIRRPIRSTGPRRCSRSSARPTSSTDTTAPVTGSLPTIVPLTAPSRRPMAGRRSLPSFRNTSVGTNSQEIGMCSYIVEKAALIGSAKGPKGWMHIDTANVYYDHPYHAPLDHALGIDFICEAEGGRDRVAVEISAELARELVKKILAALASGDAAHAAIAAE